MKKRILSLILALSMVLSVLPLGAFAADPPELVMGANGLPVYSEGTVGHNWVYMNGTLCLLYGTFDFSSTHPQNTSAGTQTAPPVACPIEIESDAEITGGIFEKAVTNNGGTIYDGTFNTMVENNVVSWGTLGKIVGGAFNGTVTNKGTISGGAFNATVTNNAGGKISGGAFQSTGSVTNYGTIENGTFNGTVTNNNTISGGFFEGTVTNSGTISGGTFQNGCSVENYIYIENGTFYGSVKNYSYIENGTFEGTVTNDVTGYITGGTFQSTCSVTNTGIIKDGIFTIKVENGGIGEIFGGIFAAGLSKKSGNVAGGVFNGKTGLDGVTGLHSITWDAASSKAKIVAVNDVSAVWDPYAYKDTTVTITADTEIYSLNGKSIDDGNCKSSYDGNKNTVKFTMPGENVVLNGAITSTDLVMENGWPQASNEGKISCSGTGWSYDHITKTLTLTSGEYDFSSTEPVQCAIQSSATITGGTFEKKVTNNAGGIISGGTFEGTVTNNGTIKKGTFKNVCSVTNNSTIENGTFKNMCRVINNKTIENGTFKNMCSVENNGTINNGTFTYKVENNGIITGGVFNRNANLTGVTGGYNITVASNAKIEKVNGVSADWAPYVVTSNATTKEVTITADTEIFSLNGQPIAESSYGSDKTTVTFTMPDDDVVLNGTITSTDLVMVNGYPKDSNGGKNPCKGDGWEYIKNDPTNGDMLLLTGSNQTGGLFDFSTIGDGSAVECNVFVGKPTAITGGEFNGKVINNSGILGGTFHGEVDNMGPGRIENGTFKNSVENNGMIENGTFEGTVENNTNGTISGGTFAGSVSNNGGTVNGGIFNGNTGLDEVTGLHSITWDAASSNAKIEKVNGVSADWKPYVVTSNATT